MLCRNFIHNCSPPLLLFVLAQQNYIYNIYTILYKIFQRIQVQDKKNGQKHVPRGETRK